MNSPSNAGEFYFLYMFIRKNIPALFWTLLIFFLCSLPGKSIPEFTWLELISFDKFVHAFIFFVLQLLYMHGLSQQDENLFLKKNYVIVPLFFGIFYGGLLELMQSLVFSERSADTGDFIANSVGVMIGAATYRKFTSILVKFYSLLRI